MPQSALCEGEDAKGSMYLNRSALHIWILITAIVDQIRSLSSPVFLISPIPRNALFQYLPKVQSN